MFGKTSPTKLNKEERVAVEVGLSILDSRVEALQKQVMRNDRADFSDDHWELFKKTIHNYGTIEKKARSKNWDGLAEEEAGGLFFILGLMYGELERMNPRPEFMDAFFHSLKATLMVVEKKIKEIFPDTDIKKYMFMPGEAYETDEDEYLNEGAVTLIHNIKERYSEYGLTEIGGETINDPYKDRIVKIAYYKILDSSTALLNSMFHELGRFTPRINANNVETYIYATHACTIFIVKWISELFGEDRIGRIFDEEDYGGNVTMRPSYRAFMNVVNEREAYIRDDAKRLLSTVMCIYIDMVGADRKQKEVVDRFIQYVKELMEQCKFVIVALQKDNLENRDNIQKADQLLDKIAGFLDELKNNANVRVNKRYMYLTGLGMQKFCLRDDLDEETLEWMRILSINQLCEEYEEKYELNALCVAECSSVWSGSEKVKQELEQNPDLGKWVKEHFRIEDDITIDKVRVICEKYMDSLSK